MFCFKLCPSLRNDGKFIQGGKNICERWLNTILKELWIELIEKYFIMTSKLRSVRSSSESSVCLKRFYNRTAEYACVNLSIRIHFLSDKSVCDANNAGVYESVFMSEW